MTRAVSMAKVIELLEDALASARGLDGQAPATSASVPRPKAEAALNRRLLRLSDSLDLTASLVRAEYWGQKEQVRG